MALVKTESTLMEDDDSSSISTSSLGTPTSCDDAPAKTGFPPRTKGDDVSCHRSDSSSLFSNVPSVKSGKTPSSRLSPSASSKSSGRAAPKDPPSDTKANATSVCSEIALSNKGVVQHTAVEAISPLAPMKKSVPREKRLSQDLQSNKRRCSDVVIANMEMCAGEKPTLGAAGSMDDPNAEESLLQPVTSIETRAAQAAVSTDEKRPAKALSSIAQKRAAKISASMEEKKPVKALASTKEKIPAKVAALTKEKRPAKEAASTEETRPKAEGKKVANRSEKGPVGEGECDVPKSPVKQAASIKKKKKVEKPHDCDVPKSYVKQTTLIQKKTKVEETKVEKSHDCDVPKSGMKQNSSINYTKVEETTVEKSHDCDVPKSPVKQTASVQKKTKVEEKKPATGRASIQKTNVSKKRRVKAKTSRMKTIIVPEEEEGEIGAENDDVEAETDLSVVEVSGTVADDHGSHDENNEDKKSEAKPPSVVDLSEEGDHSQQQAATATDPGTTSGDHTAHLSPAHSGVSVQFQVSAASSPPFSGGPKDSNKRFPSDSAKSESSTEGFVEPVKKPAAPVKLYLQIGVGARGRALRRRLRENTLAERRSEEELVKRRSEEDLAERRSEEEAAVTSTPRTRAARQKPVRATPPAAESGVVPVRAMREKKRQQVARETMEEKMAEDDSTLMSEQGWSAQKSKWAAPKEPVTPRGRGGGRGKRLKLDDAPSTDALSSEPSEGGKQTTSGGKQAIVNMSPVSVTAKRGTYSFRGSPSGPSSGGGMTRPRWVFLGKRGDPDEKCEGMDSGEQRGSLGEARSDECSEDLDSPEFIVGSGPSSPSSSAAASVDGDDSSPPSMLPMGSCSALPSAALYEPPSRKRRKLDRRKAVQKAFDMFNNNASPSYTCTQSPEEGDNLPILVISPAFLKPAAQGGNVDSSKWLQSVFDHLEGDGENGEESMIDRCEVMRLKKQFARYKPIEMRQYMIKIAATQVHSWEYLNALQKVQVWHDFPFPQKIESGQLYPRQLDTPGAIDLYSDPVVESCKRPLALARGENVMNLWTLPCALGRALAFQEVVDTLLKRERGSAAMFARPACHHVPMWRSRAFACARGAHFVRKGAKTSTCCADLIIAN
eukprot:GEMP01001536.1.p1 GENE.GEMP01001536.1~~GEMP01001536.1.p1  ORF type:complete len:1115 (+),score=270.72 GEMP01001536.1:100-3444(+)